MGIMYKLYPVMPGGAKWTIEDYQTASGESPVRTFLLGLSRETEAATQALIGLLEERGNTIRPPHSRPLGGGLFELREVKSAVRIFYMFLPGRRAVLLDGIVKKRGDIAARDLRRARRLQQEVLARSR